MAGEENLIPFSERSKEEARENGRKGGINSGKARRRKADLRKAVQIMATTEITDKNGKQATGIEIAVQGLIANLANPNGRNWGKAMDTFATLLGANLSEEQIDKIKADTELTQAKAKALSDTNIQGDGELPMLWKALGLMKDDI